jgi:hypothetical protein
VCDKVGLSGTGKKDDLIARIIASPAAIAYFKPETGALQAPRAGAAGAPDDDLVSVGSYIVCVSKLTILVQLDIVSSSGGIRLGRGCLGWRNCNCRSGVSRSCDSLDTFSTSKFRIAPLLIADMFVSTSPGAVCDSSRGSTRFL